MMKSIEDALLSWVKISTALDDEHAFFSDQKVPRPNGPYVTLRVISTKQMGLQDEKTYDYDAARPLGQEIGITLTALRSVHVSVQVWQTPTTHVSELTAVDIATRLQLGLRRPSVVTVLDGAGIAVFDVGDVRNLPALLDANFEGRAQFDLGFLANVDQVTDFIGYIASIVGTISIDRSADIDYTVTES